MKINVMSFNIRIDVKVDGQYAWPYRKDQVLFFIKDQKPDILGIQEAGPHMAVFLHENFKNDYHVFVKPRDERGESTPLFINKHLFDIVESNTIWLTDTPHILSNVEGSNYPRIATYAIIKSHEGHMLGVFNTHLDYTGDQTTIKQVKHLHNYIHKLKEKYDFKTIILGDFNSYPETKTIRYLNHQYESCFNTHLANTLTFHGFSNDQTGEPIDYIFYDRTLKNLKTVIHYHSKPDLFLSDHYPISTTLHL